MQSFAEPLCVLSAALNFKAEHTAPALHLVHREAALRVTFEKRIVDRPHFRMPCQELSDLQRAVILPFDAHCKRFNSTKQKKCSMWIHDPAQSGACLFDFGDQVPASRGHSTNQTRTPPKYLVPE